MIDSLDSFIYTSFTGIIIFTILMALLIFRTIIPKKKKELDKQKLVRLVSSQPPGASFDTQWYVHRKTEEQKAYSYLNTPGTPAVIWGPKLSGKSTLFKYLVSTFSKENKEVSTVLEIDVKLISKEGLKSIDILLKEFALQIVEKIQGSEEWVEEIWKGLGSSKGKVTKLVEKYVFSNAKEIVILAINRADAFLDPSISDDFFGLLRSWVSDSMGDWPKLRILITVETNPSYLVKNIDQSLFILSDPIQMTDFNQEEVKQLAQLYNLSWNNQDIKEIMALIGGHPYLLKALAYNISNENIDFKTVLSNFSSNSIFHRFLEKIKTELKNAKLYDDLAQIKENLNENISSETYNKLEQEGLIIQEKNTNGITYKLRYQIYEKLFELTL